MPSSDSSCRIMGSNGFRYLWTSSEQLKRGAMPSMPPMHQPPQTVWNDSGGMRFHCGPRATGNGISSPDSILNQRAICCLVATSLVHQRPCWFLSSC